MDIVVSLQRLIGLGKPLTDIRPSLAQFAHRYQPDIEDSQFKQCWNKLMSVVGHGAPDAALTGLLRFLSQANFQQNAQICMNLDCTVSFIIDAGALCLDAHDGDVVCCSPNDMVNTLQNLCDAYDMSGGYDA